MQQTMHQTARSKKSTWTSARKHVGWLAALSLVASGAGADDRELLREGGTADPFVFIIMDTSGSMTWTPMCIQHDTIFDMNPFDAACTLECTLDDATCARLCPDQGCREYSIVDEDNPVEYIADDDFYIDNDDGSPEVTKNGDWGASTNAPTYKGVNYLHDRNTGTGDNDKTVVYNPGAALDTAGTYHVFMSWATNPGFRATNVMVDITHDDGTDTVSVNQEVGGGVEYGADSEFDGWNLLGTFDLSPGNGLVTVRNESGNYFVTADAVRWARYVEPPCQDATTVYRCQQPICPLGNCYTPLNGDDPNSKFYQIKQALYGAVDAFDSVHFGFGSYEQDNPRLAMKHWLYRVRETVPAAIDAAEPAQALPTLGGQVFLEPGDEEVFGNNTTASVPDPHNGQGDGWDCDTGTEDHNIGCHPTFPVDVTDVWEAQRGHRIPKLGYKGTYDSIIWYRTDYDDNERFQVRYSPAAGNSFGDDPFAVLVEVFPCATRLSGNVEPTCAASSSATVYYDLVSDYAAWESGNLQRQPMFEAGFFSEQRNSLATPVVGTCFGMEPNDDTDAAANADIGNAQDDVWWEYGIKWPTTEDSRGDDYDFDGVADVPRTDLFDFGDRIPLDWQDRNVDEIKRRLAPNSVRGSDPEDYRIAVYFENEVGPFISGLPGTDETNSEDRRLRLLNADDADPSDDERPLIASGDTPLGEVLEDFKIWYSGKEPGDGDSPDALEFQGWSDFAVIKDPDFPCRKKFVMLFTDGLDTCFGTCKEEGASLPCDTFDNDPCPIGASGNVEPSPLLDDGVRTYVVGFGVTGSQLDCIAERGGTEAPFLPRNQNELVKAIEQVLFEVQVEQRAFASASIPAIQSTAADKIFLSSFTPVGFDDTTSGFWPGRLDAFRKPLPLTVENEPDVDRVCDPVDASSDDLQSACHLWEAGQVLCQQVRDDERIVLYGMEHEAGNEIPGAARPRPLRRFEIPAYFDTLVADDPDGTYNPADHAAGGDLAYDLAIDLIPDLVESYLDGDQTNEFIHTKLAKIVDRTVGFKPLADDFVDEVEVCDSDSNGTLDAFVLGDIFHASPVAISGPSNFTYFASDLCGAAQRTDVPNNCVDPDVLELDEDRGYRRFAADHVWRRRMLMVAANDGQLHFLDTGVRKLVDNDFTADAHDKLELFNDGTGKELFSYIPRLILPALAEQVEPEVALDSVAHVYSLDGSLTAGDVFIDPIDSRGGRSRWNDRVWRTVVIGGMREAGSIFRAGATDHVERFKSGYFALDVTQPDILGARTDDTDLTLVPCESAGCDETTPTSSTDFQFQPSCMTLDADDIVDDNAACPFRIDSPTDVPQFPAELWTFTDSWLLATGFGSFERYFVDEDGYGADFADTSDDDNGRGVPDLADTWSRPVIGQIAMCRRNGAACGAGGGDLLTKHVAIFGGGMDPDNKDPADAAELRGAYLYMVDIETGLPIYKQKLGDGTGAAPSDPAVLDIDRDGIFDVIYIGTTDGYLYKVDLQARGGDLPNLVDFTLENHQLIRDSNGDGIFERYADNTSDNGDTTIERVDPTAWLPFPILNTGGGPIYHPPAAFFIPEINRYGLALGTGDREDLWDDPAGGGPTGKFFVIVDEDFALTDYPGDSGCVADTGAGTSPVLPIAESCLYSFSFSDTPLTDYNLLLDPLDGTIALPDSSTPGPFRPGWAMTFPTLDPDDPQHRVTTEAFVVAGVLIFSVFDPVTVALGDDDDDDDDDDDVDCGRTGTTRAFVVLADNGAPVADLSSEFDTGEGTGGAGGEGGGSGGSGGSGGDDDDDDDLTAADRYHEIGQFTTAPFIERTATKNDPNVSGKTILDSVGDQLSSSVREVLISHLPRGSRFNEQFKVVIAALENSTGVRVFASIPIAVYPADWRDQ